MMRPVVLAPDAVAVAVDYLAEQLEERGDDAIVTDRVETPRPDRFVRVSRTGGPMKNRVQDGPQLTVECWDLAEEDAQDLAQLCRALLFAAQGAVVNGVPIGKVDEFGGPQLLPDPLSDQPRYTFTMQVAMRGQSLEEATAS